MQPSPSDASTAPPPPVGRLAPSTTGELHLGHARSFLIAWWHSRSRGGAVRLRFEDLDDARARPEFADLARRDLEWLGMDWDGSVVLQSERLDVLRCAALELEQAGLAYPCVCTRGDIRAALEAPHGPEEEPPYPGTCKGRYESLEQAERITGKAAGLRFSVTAGTRTFVDEFAGSVAYDLAKSPGDFLILRKDKLPAYQLSVVVDDDHQGVTEVVRGRDLLDSTPRQVAIADALGLAHVRYFHVPLVADESGVRLAKRNLARGLSRLRALGVDPRTVISWVAKSCGLDVPSRVDAREVLPLFEMKRIPSSSVRIEAAMIDKWSSER